MRTRSIRKAPHDDARRAGVRSLSRTLKAAVLQSAAIWGAPRLARAARRAVGACGREAACSPDAQRRQLLVDVSIIAAHDAGTGIQRVVRSLLTQLLRSPPDGFDVRPIRATRKTRYRYADRFLAPNAGEPQRTAPHAPGEIVRVRNGDVFLGLDLTSRIVARRQRDLLAWKRQGVRCAFIVYDLLPLQHPHWFTPRARRSFRHWLSTLAVHADELWCISRTVARETGELMRRRFRLTSADIAIRSFDLGAETLGQAHAAPASTPAQSGPCRGAARPLLLMVGTIEPRKGHAQVLDAFDALWRDGAEVTLVVVGAPGWHVEPIVQRLRRHVQNGKQLFWLHDADDVRLEALYAQADGLVMASEAEGFGLPIVEAARHGKPLFLRELDVFREVAGNHATYFRATDGGALARELSAWLARLAAGTAPTSTGIEPITWSASADQLKALVATLAEAS
ncbi:glycosyl transferases group 1 family protein [Burkholderia thailandensis USAMRU Malaysia |nr:glycosyl transferases group 1 family protein [Burkholderia thailandensis 2002721723]AHI79942.1 glycosyl transferases group 1 family protein [Burkholderia thailandensis E444]AIC88188.1 glycosyl transferases group 1 family protein [Burkholderia thailandensis USAMRU Malaysia \